MGRKKQRTNWKLDLSIAQLDQLAPKILGAFGLNAPSDRLTLTSSSGIWQKANGSLTVRLVYRSTAHDGEFTKIYTLRNITIDRERSAGGANG